MEPITFSEVASLINRIGTTKIGGQPIEECKGQWAVYAGTVQTGAISIDLKIMHVLSDATIEGTSDARKYLNKNSQKERIQVVFAPSLEKNKPGVMSNIRSIEKNCLSINDFFTSFFRQQVDNYLTKVAKLPFSNYVDPKILVAETFKRKIPNPVASYLTDPDMTSSLFQGTLGVLLAEPGQGKTYMTRYLAQHVASRGAIPLYVHSEQWSRMQRDEISSIWKTLVHSFKHFESPIGWIDGAEEQFIKTALKAGLFRIIFDGFDEYVLWNKGAVDAIETINTFQQVTEETGARILITARTSFWNSEIAENPRYCELSKQQHIFEICPFDQPMAEKYFGQIFKNNNVKKDAATQLFAALKSRASDKKMDFVGRGFFLFLIADLVKRGYSLSSLQLSNHTALQWVMKELCERERTRQQIPFTSDEQIQVFEEFTELVLGGEVPNTETLNLTFKTLTDHSESVIDSVFFGAGQLKDHPLIRLNPATDQWDFTQEQIRYALIGQRILSLCDPIRRGNDALNKLLGRQNFSLHIQSEVALAVANQIFELFGEGKSLLKTKEVVGMVLRSASLNSMDASHSNASSFATTLAHIALNNAMPKGSEHKDRTEELISMFPDNKLTGLSFTGTLSRFDFSDVVFINSNFNQVVWVNCRFNQNTRFVKCKFYGGSVMSSSKFGLSKWESNCWFDADARSLIDAECIKEGTRTYTEESLFSDMNYVLKKFIPKEGLGLHSVIERNLSTGLIGVSPHSKVIIDALKKFVISKHSVAGGDGYHVNDDSKEAVVYWATNGRYTGELAEMFEYLKKRLIQL